MTRLLLIGLLLLSSTQVFANAAAVIASEDDDEIVNSVGGIPVYWLRVGFPDGASGRGAPISVMVKEGTFWTNAEYVPLADYRCKDGLRESVLFSRWGPVMVVCWKDIRKN